MEKPTKKKYGLVFSVIAAALIFDAVAEVTAVGKTWHYAAEGYKADSVTNATYWANGDGTTTKLASLQRIGFVIVVQ